jgi:DNA repair photolyase
MTLAFEEYSAKKIVNAHKHIDGAWFWDKYSAHPYVGCRHGCEFCYTRGGPYMGGRDPSLFDTVIRVKTNAATLLRKELPRLAPDVIACGDWQQPAEDTYRISRAMLETVLENRFPLLVIERSPLLARDLDLLQAIHAAAHATVILSFSNADPALKATFEPCSPGLAPRWKLMETLAQAGIPVGMSFMPILPLVGDDDAHLADAIQAAKDHGASYVLGAGLTMADAQAERTLAAYAKLNPALAPRLRALYGWREGGKPSYGPPVSYTLPLNRKVREICMRAGLPDRMPRYIGAGPFAANRRIAEQLFLRLYDLELEEASPARLWVYRKAAWMVDEWPVPLGDLYALRGEEGLRALPGIGPGLAKEIGGWLEDFASQVVTKPDRDSI